MHQVALTTEDYLSQQRLIALDFGQGKPCGASHISASKTCHVGHMAVHGADHLGQAVASWEVGKVVGGMASQYLESQFGIPQEASRKLAETFVQGTTATALSLGDAKNRTPAKIIRRAMTEYAAAFVGKTAHGAAETFISAKEMEGLIEQVGPLLAGKMSGVSTAIAGAKMPSLSKMAGAVASKATKDTAKVASFFKKHSAAIQDFAEEPQPTKAEVEAMVDLFLLSVLFATKKYRLKAKLEAQES